MTKSLIEGIAEWLDEGGYPLELYIAKVLTKLRFHVTKSPLFSDVESDKAREIDLVASYYARNRFKQNLEFKLVIECKKSANAFVILSDQDQRESVLEQVLYGNLRVRSRDDMFVAFPFLNRKKNPFESSILSASCRPGYTIVQAHQKGDANIYAEVFKLAKAWQHETARTIEQRDRWLQESALREESKNQFYAHLPVLVVDAPLVEVFLDDEGNTQIHERPAGAIRIRRPWVKEDMGEDSDLGIFVVTKPIFADFAKEIIGLAKQVASRQNKKNRKLLDIDFENESEPNEDTHDAMIDDPLKA